MSRRRDQGEGSVYRRADGRWVGAVESGRGVDGKRRKRRIVRATKRQVLDDLDRIKRATVTGPDRTVDDLIVWWIANVAAATVTHDTADKYLWRHRHWISPHIGRVRLSKLSTVDVQSMMSGLAHRGLSPASRNLARTLVSSALKYATFCVPPLVERNVAEGVAGARLSPTIDDALSVDELDRCFDAARDDRLHALLYVSATLGLRQGEMLALTWDRVDLAAGEIEIERAKTRAGNRTLPLVAGTLEALQHHERRHNVERAYAGEVWDDHGLVFHREDGSRIHPRTLLRWWYAVQASAGIERRRWHALRHSAAEQMLRRGVPVEVVSAILGHAGIAITVDVYARVRKDIMRNELRRMEQ